MRVVYLAAGAGGMICGSCLRDNRLVTILRAQGRDVLLLPLYTPIRTDEEDASEARVLFGGVNVYLQQASPIFRHTPAAFDRLLDSRWVFDRIGKRASKTRPADVGALTVSVLRGEHGAQRKEVEKVVAALRELRPALINLPNLMMLGLAPRLREVLDVPIVCTLSGEDIFLDALGEPHKSQAFELVRAQAKFVDGFTALTQYYAHHATGHFGLPAERVHVVPMGIAVDDFANRPARRADQPFTVGYLARICPEKGLHNLLDAAVRLRAAGRSLHVAAAGYLSEADRPYFDELRRRAARERGAEFEYVGELDRAGKRDFLHGLDLFTVPADYPEAKGLSILEAKAAGVPVIQPRHGAYPELIEQTGGGVLVPPGDPDALAQAIAVLMDDPAARAELGVRAATGARTHFTDQRMAEAAWALYERLVADRRTL